jgi:uncharacterized protein (DUF736 family)
MNIGVIKRESRIVQKEGQDVKQEWLELIVRPPMMESGKFSIHPNKEKKNPNEPDQNIWYNFSRKGENYRATKIGGLWKKTSKDGNTEYFTGHIENPLVYGGKMYISCFKAKPLSGQNAEDVTWVYDVLWNPPKSNGNKNNNSSYGVAPSDIPQYNGGGSYDGNNQSMEQDAGLYM